MISMIYSSCLSFIFLLFKGKLKLIFDTSGSEYIEKSVNPGLYSDITENSFLVGALGMVLI